MKSISIVVLLLMFVMSLESQMKIIRKGGNPKSHSEQEDIAELPELASFVLFKGGELVVDKVFEKTMRPKGYESVDIREGDVIVIMNGTRMKSLKEFKNVYASIPVGSSVKLGVERGEEVTTLSYDKADPEKLPKRRIVINEGDGSGADDILMLGSTGIFIGAKGKRIFIGKVIADLPSSLKDADVKEGDAVTGINGTSVGTFNEFSNAYKKIAVGEKVTIATSRKGKELSFSFSKSEDVGRRIIKREQ